MRFFPAVTKKLPISSNPHQRMAGHPPSYYQSIVYQEKPVDTPLPWDFLDNRVKKEFLAKEFLKAKQEKKSAACPMIDCKVCNTCL